MAKPIAGGTKFIPTANPEERIPLGAEQHHTSPQTEPSKLYDSQWTGTTKQPSPSKSTRKSPDSPVSYDGSRSLSLTDDDVVSSVTSPAKQK
jgi:hypothetical protein